ncbi:MAG: PAS domain-containing sensor histidine kinase [Bacteroidales bacterium]|nr:PAS domain-containing sensor histidine kinase [Bacteroidales bacterium]MBN2749906.1 PAS domain-containing sensor histidine kinase [Bacteroidales bacterium]
MENKQLASTTHDSVSESLKLIHELEVHQLELEIQNEELMLSRKLAVESADKYIELYNSSPVGYFTLLKDGTIVELNLSGSQMLGKDRLKLMNSHFGFFVTDDTKAIFNHFILQLFSNKTKETCEVDILNNRNRTITTHLTGMISKDRDRCRLNVIDITRLKQSELEIQQKNNELRKLNTEKDKLFSILAHDLRSPFSAFLGLTEILADKLQDINHKNVQQIANSLRQSALNVFQLIENLLEWSRMQRGLVEYKPVTIRLKDSLLRSIEMLSQAAVQKGQTILLQIPDNLYVNVDIAMLESTLRNLISNAIKFSNRGESIQISATVKCDKTIEVEVSDNGIGMSNKLLEQLFHVNEQVGCKGTEGELSTGLGLLLCKEFVEKNGGEISVESVEGKGSTFTFTLPMALNAESFVETLR